MSDGLRHVVLRDATLREGRDTPGVAFAIDADVEIAAALSAAGVTEIEIVAPAAVERGAAVAQAIAGGGVGLRRTGLLYATSERLGDEIAIAAPVLDRVEILMPLSPLRAPAGTSQKIDLIRAALDRARGCCEGLGAGFPNATQVDETLVVAFARAAVDRGADRITVYDTNGSADPDRVTTLVGAVVRAVEVPVFFHGHDDLGLATANALAAVRAGAAGLDVTVNGLGDRAGNASLEQVAVLLHLRGASTGIALDRLPHLSTLVARHSGVPVSPLAPVVGAHVFAHRSPGHLQTLPVFEAFDPALVGRTRSVALADATASDAGAERAE